MEVNKKEKKEGIGNKLKKKKLILAMFGYVKIIIIIVINYFCVSDYVQLKLSAISRQKQN